MYYIIAMHILYYITSHGYGHAVRSAAVCDALGALSPDIRISIKSGVPAKFFDEELTVPHSVIKGSFDIGCLQSDGVTVLMEETLRAYSGISANNKLSLDDEARWCESNGVDCIVSDITPFAFDVADRAGIPSAAVSNFTWHDIYAPYVKRFPEYIPVLSTMAEQYAKASKALALYPSSPMPIFKNKIPTPILGRKGNDRRSDIYHTFGIDSSKRLGLIYTGNFGLDSVRWDRLEGFGGWEFIGVYPLPGSPKNFHTVTKDQFRYQDLSASADAIVGKMGYGVFSESLLNGVPLIYLPRDDFSEFQTLDAEAKRLGSGVCIDAETFAEAGWEDALENAASSIKIEPADGRGAGICASEIIKIIP
jgi:L-arabinokinase